jgi:low temperature requirement protein LtrA
VTNWLDPEQMAVRLLLVALMLVSLAMSVSIPRAFEDLGLWVGGAYAVQQIGRSVLSEPGRTASTASAWMILGGPALFLVGHAAFKLVVWRFVSWPRLAGIAVLALLALAAHAIPALALAACAAAVVTAVAATDRLPWLPRPASTDNPSM